MLRQVAEKMIRWQPERWAYFIEERLGRHKDLGHDYRIDDMDIATAEDSNSLDDNVIKASVVGVKEVGGSGRPSDIPRKYYL
jgi:hypothetical protein